MYTQKHGVNIGRWLCHGDSPLEERASWLTEADVKQIRDIGFDHTRIALKETYFFDETGIVNPRGIEILRRGIDWMLDAGLNVSVNLHILRSHFFNDREEPLLFRSEEAKQKFAGFWSSLSDTLHDYSIDQVAYEFLNEPVARDNQRWNDVYQAAYKTLRQKEPNRLLILGSNLWNQSRTFKDLLVPDDRNMILDFHFYEPLLVSHFKAPWVPMTNVPLKNKYPGKPLNVPSWLFGLYTNLRPGILSIHKKDSWHENDAFTRETIRQRARLALSVAQEHHLPLNCGEFGVYIAPGINPAASLKWLNDVLSVYEELGISWTIWCLGKGEDAFSMINADGKENLVMDVVRKFL